MQHARYGLKLHFGSAILYFTNTSRYTLARNPKSTAGKPVFCTMFLPLRSWDKFSLIEILDGRRFFFDGCFPQSSRGKRAVEFCNGAYPPPLCCRSWKLPTMTARNALRQDCMRGRHHCLWPLMMVIKRLLPCWRRLLSPELKLKACRRFCNGAYPPPLCGRSWKLPTT